MGIIIHVDMDAFYASVEQLDRPELRGQAVIVGGSVESRGVVSAASYEARRFGVHSAMPMAQAIRLCPHGHVVGVRMGRYSELSGQIREIFLRYTPLVEPISIDEAFLDVSGSLGLWGGAEAIGRDIKATIQQELGLTASLGIAPNKFLAKLGSDLEKPDGFVVITEETKQAVLDPLAIERIWGLGKVSARALRHRGIQTIAQLRTTDAKSLESIFGNQTAGLLRLARGEDDREVTTANQAKSISSEKTFATDIGERGVLEKVLLDQVEEVAGRLRKEGLRCRTITLKMRYGDFRTVTRSKSFSEPTDATETLWEQGREVFGHWYGQSGGALRLIGFGAGSLVEKGAVEKLLFVDPEDAKREKLDRAVDAIRERFGDGSLGRGG